MGRYLNPVTRFFSLLAGVISFGILTALLACFHVARPWAWGMVFGSLTAFAVLAILVLVIRHEDRKIGEAGERVEGKILCFIYTVVRYANLVRHGYVFLTADRVHLYLWDKRPYLETKVERNILTVLYQEDYSVLTLRTDGEEGDEIRLEGGPLHDLLRVMRDNGYRLAAAPQKEDSSDV